MADSEPAEPVAPAIKPWIDEALPWHYSSDSKFSDITIVVGTENNQRSFHLSKNVLDLNGGAYFKSLLSESFGQWVFPVAGACNSHLHLYRHCFFHLLLQVNIIGTMPQLFHCQTRNHSSWYVFISTISRRCIHRFGFD